SSGKAADASAHYDYIVVYRGGRASEDFAVADLMTDVVVFALDGRSFGILCLRQQRKIDWASGGNAAGYDEFNEVSAICAHEGFLCNSAALGRRYDAALTSSAAISTLPSALARSRYHVTIAANEKTKMILEMALISGVMPRRKRPQISRNSINKDNPVMIPGRIKGSSTSRRNKALPGKLARSSARAAGIPSASAIATAANATNRLFRTEFHIASSVKSSRYQSRVKSRGGKPPTPEPLNE